MTENRITVKANSKQMLPTFMFNEQGEFNIAEATRILSVTVNGAIVSVEALTGELRVGVKTNFCVMYQTAEGYDSYQSNTESVLTIACEKMTPECKVCVNVRTEDCSFREKQPLKVNATMCIYGFFVMPCERNILGECAGDIYYQKSKLNVENMELLGGSMLTVTYSNEARMPITKILDRYCTANVNNVFAGEASFQVEGEINLKIIALNESNMLTTQGFTIPFNTEVSEENVNANSTLDVSCAVNSINLTIAESDTRSIISDIELKIYGVVLSTQEIEGITDCYSISNYLQVNKESCTLDTNYCMRTIRDKINEYVKLPEEINEICCLCPPRYTVGMRTDGELSVEGVIYTRIIYMAESEVLKHKDVELPFITKLSKEHPCDINYMPSLCITNYYAKVRTAQEVEICVEFNINIRGKESKETALLSEIVMGEVKPIDDVAISLYIVKNNETLWEVCKQLNATEATVMSQNSELKLPLKGGEKIITYKELPYDC